MEKIVLILEADEYSSEALSLYGQYGRVVRNGLDDSAYDAVQVEVLVVRLSCYLGADTLGAYPNLRYVVSPTTGINHIDIHFCSAHNIGVLTLRGAADFLDGITSTTEHSLGLLLALIRHIPQAHRAVCEESTWERDRFKGRQLSSMSIGIIGLGRIGKQMLAMSRVLKMQAMVFDPHIPDSVFHEHGIAASAWEELLAGSDIVTVHADYRPENERMIDQRALDMMKRGAYLINTARGELIDEEALVSALEQGRLAGVAVDVLAKEQHGTHLHESPLLAYARHHSNVIVTPHIGGCTSDAMGETEVYMANRFLNEVAG